MTEKPFFSENENNNGLFDEGSVLDGRYKIRRITGEGGFGVTYEAVNINSGKHVAIKAQKEGNKERFLREARLLQDFADEPNIVSVLECFEENGIAFIVMEYLDGVPLTEEILKNGKWSAEKTINSFFPVMKALEHIHSRGMIHRDISPDNLMLMKDGSLILIDFGAAKDIQENNFTKTAVFKSIYSPPEQRDSGITLGSYTDLYALCATMYFCMTGIEPEDSLSRLLFDELQKPSELGTEIKPGSETALMNGLELDCTARTQEIEDLRKALEKDYPDLTDEEKERIKIQKQKRQRTILFLCAAALCCILGFLYIFRIRILFSMIETQSVWLDGSSMPETDFKNNSEKVLERVKAFAGERYLWEEYEGQYIWLSVPAELFHTADPADYVRYMLTRPIKLTVRIPDESGTIKDLGTISKSEDLESIQAADNNIRITFTKDSIKKFGETLDQAGNIIYITYDAENNKDYFTEIYTTTGDGQSISLTPDDQKDKYSVPDKLKLLQLTQEPLSAAFPVHVDWKIRWEDVNSALFPGKNQKNREEIPGTTVSIKYTLQLSNDKSIDGYDLIRTGYPAVIKNRLDSLETPYAFGMDPYNEDTIVVKIPADRYWTEEYDWIGKLGRFDFSYGSRKARIPVIMPSGIVFRENENGTWQLETTLSDSGKKDSIERLQILRQQGEQDWCLFFEDIPIFSCSVENAIQTLQESGTIIFDQSLMREYPRMDETTKHFGRFISTCLAQELRDGHYDRDPGLEMKDDKGNTIYGPIDTGIFPPGFVSDPQTAELVSKWQDEYKDTLIFDYFNDIENNFLRIKVINTDVFDPEKSLEAIEPFFREHGDALKSGCFSRTAVFLLPGAKIENRYVHITFETEFNSGKFGFSFEKWPDFYINGMPDETAAQLEEKFENYMKTNAFWAQFVL